MNKKLRFRASSGGNLMTNKQGAVITVKQLEKLTELGTKLEIKGSLTDKQTEEYNALLVKKNAPLELSDTAKSLVQKMWRKHEKGVETFLSNKYIEKGLTQEESGITLTGDLDGETYFKNEEHFDNGVLSGTPDILGPTEFVDDIKSNWDLETFMNAEMSGVYYGQLQIYMELTGRRKARLRYCLVDTPLKLIEDEERRVMWKLGITDETLDEYQDVFAQIRANMTFDHYPKEERVKTFEVDYNPEYIKELYNRCELALAYYDTIKLGSYEKYIHKSEKK